MIDFSLIMPVKGNIKGLKLTLDTFALFTSQPDKFEMHLLVDEDDIDLNDYYIIATKYKLNITVHAVKPSDNFCNDYYNATLKHCKGINIMAWNDDCYVQTNAWDDKIREKIKQYSDFKGIYLVDVYDSTRWGNDKAGDRFEFPRFPIISRKACDTVGFFFFPQVRNWPADKCIYELYSLAKCVIKCHEVSLQHDHNFDHVNDPSKSRFMRILNEDIKNGVFPISGDVPLKKLIEAMK